MSVALAQTAPRTIGPATQRWLCYGVILAVALLVRANYFGDPAPDYDEQLYHFVGERMLSGALPFVDIWDRKPLGLFLIYAFTSLVGGPGVLPYQFAACLSATIGGGFVFALSRRFSDVIGSLVAGILYVLYLSAFGVPVGQSEVFYIPILLGMALLAVQSVETVSVAVVSRKALWMMVLGGVALQIKYSVLPQCLFFGVVALWRLHRLSLPLPALAVRAMLYGACGLLPTALVAGFYFATGHFEAFAFANFLSIFDRGPLTGHLRDAYRMLVGIMAFPLIVCALAGAWKFLRRADRSASYAIVLGWSVSAAVSSLMIGNIYIHYFAPVVAPLLILASPALAMSRSGAILGGTAAVLAVFFYNPGFHKELSIGNRHAIAGAADVLAPYVGRGRDCLYVFDGPTALYPATHSCLPTIYIYPDHLSNSMEAPAIGVDAAQEVRRILANRPAAIITASRPIVPRYNALTAQLVNQAVARDYIRVAAYDFHPRKFYINVRRDLVDQRLVLGKTL